MTRRLDAVGMAWFRREDYPRILTMFEDADGLPRSYEDWLTKAEGMHDELRRAGTTVVEATVDPDAFVAWCKAHGHRVNSAARQMFAAEFARDHVRGSHGA